MGTAQGDYDAARLLLVMNDEDLAYLRQALLDTPNDARLVATVAQKERMRAAYLILVDEARVRLEQESRPTVHEALQKRVRSALALAILDCNKDMTTLLDDVARALSVTPCPIAALVPVSTLRDALEVAELAWQIDATAEAGETLNGLAFNLLPKLRALLPPGPPQQGGGGPEEDEDFKAQLKRIVTPAGGALREGAGEQVRASGLPAESNEAACGRKVTIHHMAGGSTEILAEPTGNRRFWPVGGAVDSSGLTAESLEASATSSVATAAAGDAAKCEPGAGTATLQTQLDALQVKLLDVEPPRHAAEHGADPDGSVPARQVRPQQDRQRRVDHGLHRVR